jgi:hypothetical protein
LLPLTLLGACIIFFKKNLGAWKKLPVIILIAVVLNTGQIASEMKTNFANTHYFLSELGDRSPQGGSGIGENVAADFICHAQANILYLASLDNYDTCDSLSAFKFDKRAQIDAPAYLLFVLSILGGAVIFIASYALLIRSWRQEEDVRRKMFLGLNVLFGAACFLVVLPVITHNGQVRYLLPEIFMPLVALGLAVDYFFAKAGAGKKYFWAIGSLFVLLVVANFTTMISEAKQHFAKTRSNATYVVLGEIEAISRYMAAQAYPDKEAYLLGGQKYMQNYVRPLDYVSSEIGLTLIRGGKDVSKIPAGKTIFFIGQSLEGSNQVSEYDAAPAYDNLAAQSYKSFGNLGVYELKNQT